MPYQSPPLRFISVINILFLPLPTPPPHFYIKNKLESRFLQKFAFQLPLFHSRGRRSPLHRVIPGKILPTLRAQVAIGCSQTHTHWQNLSSEHPVQ